MLLLPPPANIIKILLDVEEGVIVADRFEATKDVDDVAVGIGTFSVGPMISFSISDNVSWDLKPQYAISMKAVYADDSGTIDDVEFSGNAFIFANSLVFGDGGSGFAFSIDLDYLSGKFTEFEVLGNSVDIDDENKMNNFKIGVGLRYNF